MKKTKRKIIVKKQVTIIYCEYEDGIKTLKGNIPPEITRWIGQDYIKELQHRDNIF